MHRFPVYNSETHLTVLLIIGIGVEQLELDTSERFYIHVHAKAHYNKLSISDKIQMDVRILSAL